MMPIEQVILSLLSGALVGFILGFIGSGGSILALPLLVYVVGFAGDPHVAIGTTALAVAVSALANMVQHQRKGNVRLRPGILLAIPGILGALLGATLGLSTPSDKLLFLFALLMLFIAARMWRDGRSAPHIADSGAPEPRVSAKRVVPAGFGVGALSGYFGIGGGFLIVPALTWSARLDMRRAIGTSLVAVAAFGLTTAARYGLAGKLDLPIAGLFIAGGLVGGVAGTYLSHRAPQARLRQAFAIVLVVVALYMLARNWTAFAP